MIIKKFLGKTEEEAVEAAKKELGNGIVIMNVKSVKHKGIMSLFRPKMTEVTVALEEEKETLERTRREAPAATNVKAPQSAGRTGSILQGGSSENIEKKLDSLQTLLENQFKSTQEKRQEQEKKEEELSRDMGKADEKSDKTMEAETAEENPEQEKFIRLLYNTMIDNEVDEKYVNQILGEIEKTKKPNVPMDYLLANIYQKMILKFGKAEGITPAAKGPKVVLFIGPTGVGKTTTIAKVASHFAVDEKKKVALLTLDTYRIAAAEQLRTYANILEVPFRVIYTSEELKRAIADFKEYDYIFVDTAGHSHQNEEQLSNMKELLASVADLAEKDIFLVLSATTKYRDLLKIAENYKSITEYQLIFTKLDETSAVGNLLNLKLFTDSSIAYITCGQNVPDDIERFNPQKTVKQLLGGKN